MAAAVALGLVGAGRLAELGYLPAAELSQRARIVAVADPDPRRLELLAGSGRTAHGSAEALLAAGGVDGVVVASPADTHEHVARLATAQGLPVLVEKPPAPDLAGAQRIAALDPAPRIGFNRRFSLGDGLEACVPGSGSIELELRYRRFKWSPVAVRDPALLDLAPHLADLALRAGTGKARRVTARSARPERVEISVDGEAAQAAIKCATDRAHLERAIVRRADGRIVARSRYGGLVRGSFARLRRGPHPLVASLTAQIDEFAGWCTGEAAPRLATAADGVAAMAIVAAAAESLALGGEPVAPPASGVPT
jgi:predicted dehydrogenase